MSAVANYFGLHNNSLLSRKTGIPVSTVQTKMAGTSPFQAHEIRWLARAFNEIPVEVLFLPAEDALAWVRANRPEESRLTRAIGGYLSTLSAA